MFKGLSVTKFASFTIAGRDRSAYRVWADFSNPHDRLIAIGGPLSIESTKPDGLPPGSNFFNPLNRNTCPTDIQIHGGVDGNANPVPPVPNAAYETYVTIGVHNASHGTGPNNADQTHLSEGFPNFIKGVGIFAEDIRWFTPEPHEQGRAGRYPPDNRVLIMQLSVEATSGVRGSVAVEGLDGETGKRFQFGDVRFAGFDRTPIATSVAKTSNTVRESSVVLNTIRGRKVFVVHGHDEEMKQAVARVLTMLDLIPIILHEQPNSGKTIIEKFEHNSDVGFAIVLLSPDDQAYPTKTDPAKALPRARQNVILELGFFVGKLGRGCVMALKREEAIELPNDISGVVYTPYDHNGAWRYELVRELKAAGYPVDANRLSVAGFIR